MDVASKLDEVLAFTWIEEKHKEDKENGRVSPTNGLYLTKRTPIHNGFVGASFRTLSSQRSTQTYLMKLEYC
jgi:hypothetical protein